MHAPSRHHEPGARRVERPGGLRRVLVLGDEAAHRAEAGEDQRVDARLRAAREHGVGVAAADQLGALADRVRAGRAGRDRRVVRAADAERDRDLAARRVDEHARDEERRDAVGAALAQHVVCSTIPGRPPIAEPTTTPTRAGSTPLSPPSRQRLLRGAEREQDVAVDPPRLLRAARPWPGRSPSPRPRSAPGTRSRRRPG